MRTGRVEYVEPLCGYAMRYLLLLFEQKCIRGNTEDDIEVKVWSEEYPA